MEPVTLVDAENIRRSTWPNIGKEELVELVRAWAEATNSPALVVFDGQAPSTDAGLLVKVVSAAQVAFTAPPGLRMIIGRCTPGS